MPAAPDTPRRDGRPRRSKLCPAAQDLDAEHEFQRGEKKQAEGSGGPQPPGDGRGRRWRHNNVGEEAGEKMAGRSPLANAN